MHGLNKRGFGIYCLRKAVRSKSTSITNSSETVAVKKSEVVNERSDVDLPPQKAANASTVYRPPYYRKIHEQKFEPLHMLQEEFPNAGDASGAGVRLFDYYKTAEIVNSLPTIKEKIDFVSPYERPWTRAEKTWHRDWHPSLMATRKAWALPPTPLHFETLDYYQYLTKSNVEHKSLGEFYDGLRPPTNDFEESFLSTMQSMNFGDGLDFTDEQCQKLLGTMIDDAMGGIAHNMTRLSDHRVAYDVSSEAFWVRGGFMFLYDVHENHSGEVVRKLHDNSKFIGDDRRKLGELAFVHRDKLAAQLRGREPLGPIFSIDSDRAISYNGPTEPEFSPKVYNLWPDSQPLWQCPGYHADSGETHTYGLVGVKSLRPLRSRVAYWMGWENDKMIEESQEAIQMFDEAARSQAVASLFTTLCAQAHCHGFTQYNDVTRPFTSQLILSDGIKFYFAIGQLNTLAINIDCEGFVNPKSNYVQIDGPYSLFTNYEDGKYSNVVFEKTEKETKHVVKEGLNEKVLERITQMLMKQ